MLNIFNQTFNQKWLRLQGKKFSSSLKQIRNYILTYQFIEDTYYKRIPFRDAHLNLIEKMEKNGVKIFGGQHFPLNGCTIFFESDKSEVEDFVMNDPLVKNNLVKSYEIKEVSITTKKKIEDMSMLFKYK